MSKFIFLIICISLPSIALGDELTIIITNKNNKKLAPGEHVTLPIKIQMSMSTYAKAFVKAQIPDGWHCILDEETFTLPPGGSLIRLMNIKVPSNAAAGNFTIKISAYDHKSNKEIANAQTTIEITEKIDLDLDIIDVPGYIKSGETINARAILKSNSNKEISVRLQPRNCNIKGNQSFLLQPGDDKIIELTLVPYSEVNTVNSFTFGINAMVAGNDSLRYSVNEYINVIPSEFKRVDNRFRYPVFFKATYLSRYFEEGLKHAFQGEAYGIGTLGKQSDKFIEFRLRGPNTYSLSSLGKVDEYFLKFKSRNLDLLVGDNLYKVTPLSEPGRYARGAGIAGRIGKFEISSYYNQPRFYPDVKQTLSATATYQLNQKYKLGVHYLAKEYTDISKIAHIGSITGEFEPVEFTKLYVEYSRSQLDGNAGNGVFASVNSMFWRINLSGFVIYTDPDYAGYFTNTISYNANFNLSIFKGFSLNASFRRDERNAARDTLFATAPFTISYRTGLNWMITKLASLRGYAGYREREDLLPDKKFHYEEYFARLEYNQIVRKFAFRTSGEIAQTTNFLLTENNNTPSYGFFADIGYRPKNNINLTAFASYRNDNRYTETTDSKLYYGLSIDAWFTKRSHLYLRFQNAYALEEYYRDRDFLTLMFNQFIGNNQEIGLRTQYGMLQRDVETIDLSVEVSYTYHLGIPFGSDKVKYGTVRGTIQNLGVKTVAGIILTLNSYKTVTDRNGDFVFEEVLPGSYYLVIDKTSIDFQDISDRPMPVRVQVEENGESIVELGLTRSGVIEGNIKMGDNKPLPPVVSKIVVEMKRGNEIIKSITTENGQFRFSGIRPGTWEIILHDEGLNNAYYFAEKEFEMDIEPGENITLPVKLFKKERIIKIKPTKSRIIQMNE